MINFEKIHPLLKNICVGSHLLDHKIESSQTSSNFIYTLT